MCCQTLVMSFGAHFEINILTCYLGQGMEPPADHTPHCSLVLTVPVFLQKPDLHFEVGTVSYVLSRKCHK